MVSSSHWTQNQGREEGRKGTTAKLLALTAKPAVGTVETPGVGRLGRPPGGSDIELSQVNKAGKL